MIGSRTFTHKSNENKNYFDVIEDTFLQFSDTFR